jgi:sterol desaturase/sphingolipid hydroxylase (fatty acid hydroxylase superfamily)
MDIHVLYNGRLARPVTGLLVQAAGISAGFVAASGVLAKEGALPVVAQVMVGLAGWTLFEYALHRWAMHCRIRKVWELLHQQHHQMREMYNAEHRLLHPFVPLLVCGGTLALLLRAGGAGAAVLLGYWVGYAVYELIHWAHHDERLSEVFSRWEYYRRRAATHRDHHFRHPRANYGFTTQFWDHVFGTSLELEDGASLSRPSVGG